MGDGYEVQAEALKKAAGVIGEQAQAWRDAAQTLSGARMTASDLGALAEQCGAVRGYDNSLEDICYRLTHGAKAIRELRDTLIGVANTYTKADTATKDTIHEVPGHAWYHKGK
jgi:hypothetical protein